MLDKDQALAAMDAHIIRVEAERQRRLERRMHGITVLYPSLRSVPLSDRESVLIKARGLALRSWTLHATAVLGAAVVFLLIVFREQIVDSRSAFPLFLAALVVGILLMTSLYLHVRSSVRRLVTGLR